VSRIDPKAVSFALSGRAARWIKVLSDFGHLTPESLDRLYVAVADLAHAEGLRADRAIDLPLVRRAAALILDPAAEESLSPHLDEDWPILFS
jgi:hypothetical protein